jgi:hypothetical protein
MTFRPEFREALALVATAVERLTAKGHAPPVLVGGGAVELYTGGQITSGDFDFVSGQQMPFFEELEALGFMRPSTVGWLNRSLWHPELLVAVQVVSQPLMDGRADRGRIRVIEIDGAKLSVIPIEDLIADRMAQALASGPIRKDMQNQAVRLYQFAEGLDTPYLDRRIRTETGNEASLETLSGWVMEWTR